MINIKKTHGPASLQTYAANGYRYDEHQFFLLLKQEIRECLCDEQGYICCYCMRRIEPNGDSMQIAHMKNQEEHQDLDCQYSNMLGSCSCMETCNQKQKQHDLKFYPTDINHSMQMLIHFDSNGTISATDTEFNDELNKWLNLNSAKMLL